jgi:hypothetical protein
MAEKRAQVAGTASLERFLADCEVIPPLEDLRKVVDKNLVLTNPQYPRKAAVDKITKLIYGWLHEFGSNNTLRMVRNLLQGSQLTVVTPKGRSDGDSANGEVEINYAPGGGADNGVDSDTDRRLGNLGDEHNGDERKAAEGHHEDSPGAAERGTDLPGDPAKVLPRDGVDAASRRLVAFELSEHETDLFVFRSAYNMIHRRVIDVKDEGRLMKLVTWSGTSAVMGSLELTIHLIERTVGELRDILRRIDSGEIHNTDQ